MEAPQAHLSLNVSKCHFVGNHMPRLNIKTFCGFPWVETSTAGRVYELCVYYMTGAPEGSPKVVLCGFMVFMEKPGIEPATPGLQGIALIHYTTGAAQYINGPTYEKTFLPNRPQSSLPSLYKDNSYHFKMVHA